MKKKDGKRRKISLRRKLCFFAVVLFLLLLALEILIQVVIVQPENVKKELIEIQDVSYFNGTKSTVLNVTTENGKYHFSEVGGGTVHSISALRKKIHPGDTLYVSYVESFHLFHKRNVVVAASTEQEVYVSQDFFFEQHKKATIGFIVIWLLILLIAVACYVDVISLLMRLKTKSRNK